MLLKNNKVELYVQIKEHYQNLILLGVYQIGAELPSLRSVARQLGVNPNTVEKAYRLLENEGLIEIYPKKGAYVKEAINTNNETHLNELKDLINRLKKQYQTDELRTRILSILEDKK